jgi:hypothetical protein
MRVEGNRAADDTVVPELQSATPLNRQLEVRMTLSVRAIVGPYTRWVSARALKGSKTSD